MRIVSLVPSITELLYHLGLDQATVGITKFCVHPQQWYHNKQRVGGTKSITVKALHPTLVIAGKEENVKEQVEALATFSEILLTDVGNFEEALQMIRNIGGLTNTADAALRLAGDIQDQFERASTCQPRPATAAYLIWKDPWMTVGGDTFINAMMEKAGFENIAAGLSRYPQLSIQHLKDAQPRYIFLSSEPYPFKLQDQVFLQQQLPLSKVSLVDGEMFSWYGSRMLQAAGYFEALRAELAV